MTAATGTGRTVALTFDDGPNGATTHALLDVLAARGAPAVFCVVGANVAAAGGAEVVRRIVAEGHQLGNHTMTYADLGDWPAARVRADLVATCAVVRAAAGDVPVPWFRAPNGNWGVSARIAVSLGMRPLGVVNTIDDWRTQHVPTLMRNLRRALQPGELLLAHDGGGDRWGTVAAVETFLDELVAQGWSFTFPDPAAG